MKTKVRMIVVVVLALVAFRVITKSINARHGDSSRVANLHASAKEAVLRECTNDVVGLNRVIHLDIIDTGDVPSQWSAFAVLEYVNPSGGISRTNLNFSFKSYNGDDLQCEAVTLSSAK